MRGFKEKGFSERLGAAAEARKAQLEKFRAKPGPDDPATVERQEARRATAIARDARDAERKTTKDQTAAKEAERHAAEQAGITTREADALQEAADKAARDVTTLAEQKAARDARYAARKARKR
jgi:hypothetical protein